MISSASFSKSYTRLIILAWVVPALFGLSFIGYIQILTVDELIGIMITPTEPAFIVLWLIFAYWYFRRYIRPVTDYLDQPDETNGKAALECMRNYPLHFWSIFLFYLITAPASVILSAEYFTGFVAQPVDWFRIHFVALIVSIIVGLPIFFRMLDLFGEVVSNLDFSRPHITIKTKVFLIGALVPLLIDTMIVQYYWSRTGFFTFETFFIWLMLEVLAIAGSLIFVHSFSQSLSPLEDLVGQTPDFGRLHSTDLVPRSTDEIGVLTGNFRKALDELHEYREHLEELVGERTGELQRLNRELEAFSYSVSHDLRTPLRAIDGFSQALMEDYAERLDETGMDYLTRIRGASQHMSELIDDMLQLSRITRSELIKANVDLTSITHEVVERHRLVEQERNIKIHVDQGLACICDRKLIMIVMDNLIGNAWKYTSKKEIAEITVGRQQVNGKDIFFVKDNGVGFDMRFADKLFGVFQRLHSTQEFSGTGVGLATVQRILHRHGGNIWAESVVGEGATFYFTV
ncbi:MAG: ATP-binding protein [Pseudomonadota bacterium]|nr:ATP-binding protein [Pseudomonadota bacterium]